MKLAILGADSDTLAIAQVIDGHVHELVAVCEFGQENIAGPTIDNWETLLDDTLAEAVIVGRSLNEDLRTEQLRKFLQAGMPVLATHPLFSSMLVYYELDMIRRDTGSVLLPYLPYRSHPVIVELGRLLESGAQGPIGQIEQVVVERHLGDRGEQMVKTWFARDVDLLRSIVGELSRLGAMAGGAPQSFANLNVQMSGPADLLVRWSVAPAESHDWGRVLLLGSTGRAVVTMPQDGTPWSLELTVGGNRMDRQIEPTWNPAEVALQQLSLALTGRAVRPDWSDAARSLELTETIDRSLRRGRTIELHQEEHSEEGTFKGIMTALGCGLLIAGLIFLVLIAAVEDLGRAVGLRMPFVAHWPTLLLALLCAFLLLQLLLLLIRSSKQSNKPATETQDREK